MAQHNLIFYDDSLAPRGIATWGCSCRGWYGYTADEVLARERMAAHLLADKLGDDVTVGEMLTADDVLSDAAFLDECAMRFAAARQPNVHRLDWKEACADVAEDSYTLAEIMLAERKRRRDGQ